MNISESFDCERFLSLGGSELVAYAEPFVNTRMVNAPESAYDILAPRLGRLDEEHTVYALEICMAIKPSEFVSVVIGFLSNTSSAVCCTAFRVLEWWGSADFITPELVRKIAETPVVDLITRNVRTGEHSRRDKRAIYS